MELPPGEPKAATGRPSPSNTITGDMDERGRLPGPGALAAGRPSTPVGDEKSVSWLFRNIPAAIRPEPKIDSTVVVMETMLPLRSMITKWVVPPGSWVPSGPGDGAPGGFPGGGAAAPVVGISAARVAP